MISQKAAPGLMLCAVAAALPGCGGGGGGGGGNPPPATELQITTSSLLDGIVGVPYAQVVATSGGTGAKTFSISAGALPDGLELNASNGAISGTPAGPTGTTDFSVSVEDSATPPGADDHALAITINAAAVGRNDSIGEATPLTNGTYSASISPSGDPAGVFEPDEDYYSVTTTAASTVTVDINAQFNGSGSPLDSVIEIVDEHGVVINACGTPNFNSACISDDEQPGNLDSFLQVSVDSAGTFYIHVVDWSMNARPDMLYDLEISGVN
jgi:putative Ig domain-containing protein